MRPSQLIDPVAIVENMIADTVASANGAAAHLDDERKACNVLCVRDRDTGHWWSVSVHRATLSHIERSTVAGAPPLVDDLLAEVERAAALTAPFPFAEPSEERQRMRHLAEKLWDRVAERSAG